MGHSAGKIFLNEQRGTIETALYQRNCTFNFEDFFSGYKSAFGPLYLLNDEILAGNANLDMSVMTDSYVILIPITGDLQYNDSDLGEKNISIGQLMITKLSANSRFRIANCYESEAISFLQIWIQSEDTNNPFIETIDFELGSFSNPLTSINIRKENQILPFRMNIGTFDGRSETIYQKGKTETGFFCFVIAGAFEVEGRLLHAKDGLALWDLDEVEMEALSNNALIFTLEFPML